jgi:hypothetical protein
MFRSVLLFSALSLVPTAIGAQILMPGGAKPVTKPAVPVMVMPVTPVTSAPVGPVNANRTLELLKNAGIINPTNVERPVALTPRSPYVDEATYFLISAGDYAPGRNVIGIRGPEGGVTSSFVGVFWNPTPDRRYVIDCAFDGDGNDVTFSWDRGVIGATHVAVAGGHAGAVLPVGVLPPVRMNVAHTTTLSECDITPFGA